MVWNAVNDVVFGWLSDAFLKSRGGRLGRLPVIRVAGALWALAFYLAWFPWGGAAAGPGLRGLNWAVNLCVYDAMLTLVEVNHHALLAELSPDGRERAHLNRWSSLCAAVGSLTSLAGHIFWDQRAPAQGGGYSGGGGFSGSDGGYGGAGGNVGGGGGGGSGSGRGDDLRCFKCFALVVALGAFACFELATRHLGSLGADGKKTRGYYAGKLHHGAGSVGGATGAVGAGAGGAGGSAGALPQPQRQEPGQHHAKPTPLGARGGGGATRRSVSGGAGDGAGGGEWEHGSSVRDGVEVARAIDRDQGADGAGFHAVVSGLSSSSSTASVAPASSSSSGPSSFSVFSSLSLSSSISSSSSSLASLVAFVWSLRLQGNFVIFAAMASLQTFDCAVGKQFFTIFLALIVGDALPPSGHGAPVAVRRGAESSEGPWMVATVVFFGGGLHVTHGLLRTCRPSWPLFWELPSGHGDVDA